LREETALKQELIHFDAISRALQRAASVDEAKGIRDKAEALRIYAKQSGQTLEVQNRCAEIKLRAERRAGEILSEMEMNKGARGKGVRFRDESAPTLAELGISQAQSHRWQKIAGIPMREFDSFISARKQSRKELTSISVLRLADDLNRPPSMRQPETGGLDEALLNQISSSVRSVFNTVVVDPPWEQLGRHPEVLWKLPIPSMCAKNAHLYLWVTNKTLEQGFELLRLWGFRYTTCLTWCKSQSEGGECFESSTEHILFAKRGNLQLSEHDVGTWFQWPWGSIHTEKPDRFYELVASCSPGPYAVLFSEKQRPGWTCVRLGFKTGTSTSQSVTTRTFDMKDFSTQASVHYAVGL
jgi:N6-adenosine-specific RNA methylase IME4